MSILGQKQSDLFQWRGPCKGRLPNEAMPGHHASGKAVLCDIHKCVINKEQIQESGTLHLHYLVLRQPSRDTCVDVKGPTGCAPPPVCNREFGESNLEFEQGVCFVIVLCFVLACLGLGVA